MTPPENGNGQPEKKLDEGTDEATTGVEPYRRLLQSVSQLEERSGSFITYRHVVFLLLGILLLVGNLLGWAVRAWFDFLSFIAQKPNITSEEIERLDQIELALNCVGFLILLGILILAWSAYRQWKKHLEQVRMIMRNQQESESAQLLSRVLRLIR